jgi:hypothetical protein
VAKIGWFADASWRKSDVPEKGFAKKFWRGDDGRKQNIPVPLLSPPKFVEFSSR